MNASNNELKPAGPERLAEAIELTIQRPEGFLKAWVSP